MSEKEAKGVVVRLILRSLHEEGRLTSLMCSACHAMEELQTDYGIITYQGHLTKFCVL